MSRFSRRASPASVPLSLTLLRALLAPVVVALAIVDPLPWAFAACLIIAFLSDIFDGVIARRLGVATPTLRRLDSVADSCFYLAATFAAWHLYPQVIRDNARALLALGVLEIVRYVFDLAKFRREASYHMWSSKLWGVALFVAFFALLVFGETGTVIAVAIYAGIVSDLEGLAISAALPNWKSDVPSFVHALRLRRAANA